LAKGVKTTLAPWMGIAAGVLYWLTKDVVAQQFEPELPVGKLYSLVGGL